MCAYFNTGIGTKYILCKVLVGKYMMNLRLQSVGEAHSHRKRETDRTAASARGSAVPRVSCVSSEVLPIITQKLVHPTKENTEK